MPSLFISYRRADSPDTVKLIHERLKGRLPRWDIFYDHESIPLGEPFPERLRTKVMSAAVVLVIIGPKWLDILCERINGPIDHVREEVRLALQAGASVVPVLVGRADMPADVDLAEFADLQPLLLRNGRPVRPDPDFDGDLEPIITHLKQFDAGETIGTTLADKYTLTAEIGHGGMGVVYAAQQKQPVKRTVAVKLIKPGMDSRDVLARFDAERQALAVMDHPHISRVLDAGIADSGRPFFVMEYVKGVPITQYCDDKKLTPQERLHLFIPVCNAVQHAHQKGIIHRDLKPTNVLVEVFDGKPVPKVIDFGLAKALGQQLTDKTLHTALDTRVGTLEYSAPEQAAGRTFDVDTRSDIYSLGVMLYELLTGGPPFTHEELLKIGEEEMRRVIREDEPVKPSKKLSSSGELPAIAANRHLEPKKLTRLVQGDLDWIVMKCLEKEIARRYETANQLGQELERFLADEPVQAGPPSVGYRTKKFLRRNRGAVIAAGMVFLALVAGIVGTSIGFIEARWARDAEAHQRGLAEVNEAKAQKAATDAIELAELLRQKEIVAAGNAAEAQKAAEDARKLAEFLRQKEAAIAKLTKNAESLEEYLRLKERAIHELTRKQFQFESERSTEREVRSDGGTDLDWALDFKFKNPRMIKSNVPGQGPRIYWYMWYQVINRTREPRRFVPYFEIVTVDRPAVYRDSFDPAVLDAIKADEDPTGYQQIKDFLSIASEMIPVPKPDALPRAVTGVAIWEANSVADPKKPDQRVFQLSDTTRFSIYIRGLSNEFVKVDPLGGQPASTRFKTLQLNFAFTGNGITFQGSPEWVYRPGNTTIAPVLDRDILMMRALDLRMKIAFKNEPMKQVFEKIEKDSNGTFRIRLNEEEFRMEMLDPQAAYDDLVTKEFKGLFKVRTFLRMILQERGLGYYIEDGIFHVTSGNKALSKTVVKNYPVANLIGGQELVDAAVQELKKQPPGQPPTAGPVFQMVSKNIDALQAEIMANVEPEYWKMMDPNSPSARLGSISFVHSTSSLQIRASLEVHYLLMASGMLDNVKKN